MNKNRIIAILILILNICILIPETIDIIITDGGAMGFGWMIFPFTVFLNLFIISAFLSFTKKFKDSNVIFWTNQFGLILIIFCLGYAVRSKGY